MKSLLLFAIATATLSAQVRLQIVVVNSAGVPPTVFARAVKLARETFDDAHLHANWVSCEEAASCIGLGACHISVEILPRVPVHPAPLEAEGELAGYTVDVPEEPRAFVFYDPIRAFVLKGYRRPDVILGCLLIHELGHALGLSHQAYGVMQAAMRPNEMDNIRLGFGFTKQESSRIRAAAQRLCAAPRGDAAPRITEAPTAALRVLRVRVP